VPKKIEGSIVYLLIDAILRPNPTLNTSYFLIKAMSASADTLSFPSGSWTLHFHDPEDTTWSPESYKKIGTFSNYSELWGTLKQIGDERFLSGMYFLMKDPYLPLWEHRTNIHGGSYCIKVPEANAIETFQRYAAAAILEVVSTDSKNNIIGVTISPKKGFHILKLWNLVSKTYNKPTEVYCYGEGMKNADILYRPHVDQKM